MSSIVDLMPEVCVCGFLIIVYNNTVLMHKRNEILQTEDKNNDLLSSKLDFNFLLKLETTKILCIAH